MGVRFLASGWSTSSGNVRAGARSDAYGVVRSEFRLVNARVDVRAEARVDVYQCARVDARYHAIALWSRTEKT